MQFNGFLYDLYLWIIMYLMHLDSNEWLYTLVIARILYVLIHCNELTVKWNIVSLNEFCPNMKCYIENLICLKTFFQMSFNKPAYFEVEYGKLTVLSLLFIKIEG